MSGNDWKIPLYKVFVEENDQEYIDKVIQRGTFWAIGPEIDMFEEKIANYVGVKFAVVFNSGTSALHAAMLANNIGIGDEIVVPSFSFVATVNSVLFVGAKPVFSDIEEENFGLDPRLISEKITNKTKAVLPMDYGGIACKIEEIKKITDEENVLLIDDSAESLGAIVNNKKCGSIADCSIFSFAGNKILTTGEGGAVVTNSKNTYEKLKMIRSHGRLDKKNYFEDTNQSKYVSLGYNWRMSSITAAIGIKQIEKLDTLIKMRQNNASYITSHLSKISKIRTPKSPSGYSNAHQMYTIRLSDKEIRDSLQQHLTRDKIFSKIYFSPIHLTDFYRERFNCKEGQLPITEKISDQVLTLPMYPSLTKEEMDYIINSVFDFFEINKD